MLMTYKMSSMSFQSASIYLSAKLGMLYTCSLSAGLMRVFFHRFPHYVCILTRTTVSHIFSLHALIAFYEHVNISSGYSSRRRGTWDGKSIIHPCYLWVRGSNLTRGHKELSCPRSADTTLEPYLTLALLDWRPSLVNPCKPLTLPTWRSWCTSIKCASCCS